MHIRAHVRGLARSAPSPIWLWTSLTLHGITRVGWPQHREAQETSLKPPQ